MKIKPLGVDQYCFMHKPFIKFPLHNLKKKKPFEITITATFLVCE